MTIEFSPEQYRQLVLNTIIASHVSGQVADARGEKDLGAQELEEYLLSLAGEFGADDLVEYEDNIPLANQKLEGQCHEILDAYDDELFWQELIERLAERDARKDITVKDYLAMQEGDPAFDERIEAGEAKYAAEFEEHGLNRLKIGEDAS